MYRKHIKHNVSWSDMSFMDQKSRQTAGSCLAGNNKQKAKHAGYGKNSAKSLFQFMNIIMYIYIYIYYHYYCCYYYYCYYCYYYPYYHYYYYYVLLLFIITIIIYIYTHLCNCMFVIYVKNMYIMESSWVSPLNFGVKWSNRPKTATAIGNYTSQLGTQLLVLKKKP